MQKMFFILVASLFASSNIAYAANNVPASSNAGGAKKIVKWVDSSGATHYGDKLPAQEAGRNNSEMNNQGIVVKRNIQAVQSNEVLDQQNLEKERKDKILLASYTKAEEIDLARDRNLQLDQAAVQALTQQKINVTNRTARNNKTAEGFRARKKPLPAYLSEELKLSKTEYANIDKQLTQRKLSMEATRKRYAEEKARFIALKYPDEYPNVAPATTPAAADAPKAEAMSATSGVTSAANPVTPKPNAAPAAKKSSPASPK
jgi:hypothetical protein